MKTNEEIMAEFVKQINSAAGCIGQDITVRWLVSTDEFQAMKERVEQEACKHGFYGCVECKARNELKDKVEEDGKYEVAMQLLHDCSVRRDGYLEGYTQAIEDCKEILK